MADRKSAEAVFIVLIPDLWSFWFVERMVTYWLYARKMPLLQRHSKEIQFGPDHNGRTSLFWALRSKWGWVVRKDSSWGIDLSLSNQFYPPPFKMKRSAAMSAFVITLRGLSKEIIMIFVALCMKMMIIFTIDCCGLQWEGDFAGKVVRVMNWLGGAWHHWGSELSNCMCFPSSGHLAKGSMLLFLSDLSQS